MPTEPKKKEKGSLVVNPSASKDAASVESFIVKAIEQNVPVETMEKLFDLRAKVKTEQAKEQFVSALSNFQAQCPIIEKKKKVLNKDGKAVRYMYAPIDSIVEQIRKSLADNGLSYRWNVENSSNMVNVTCVITHTLGHSESSSFGVPIDPDSYMTSPQKYASASTFARRYSLCNALGISTGDEDTDAVDVGKEKEAISIKSKIMFQLKALGYDVATKEMIEKNVKDATSLDLKPENFEEISSRLQVLISESHENKKV